MSILNDVYLDVPLEKFPLLVTDTFEFEGTPVVLPWASVSFDPAYGTTLARLGQRWCKRNGAQMRFVTLGGQHLVLFNERDEHLSEPVAQLFKELFFEYALLSNADWGQNGKPLKFDMWSFANDDLREHIHTHASEFEFADDDELQLKASSRTVAEGSLPAIEASMELLLTYSFSSTFREGQVVKPQVSYVFRYDRPQEIEVLREHERMFCSLLDFIWCQGHAIPEVCFKLNGRRTHLYRKSTGWANRDLTYATIRFDKALILNNLVAWSAKWYALSEKERRPFENAAQLFKNPSMPVDLRLASALHCIEGIDKLKEPKGNLATRLSRLQHRWTDINRMSTTSKHPYLHRVAFTRNDIIHLEPHTDTLPGDLLSGVERTRAYYEALVMIRASFIELMGGSAGEANAYAKQALEGLAHIEYRYS